MTGRRHDAVGTDDALGDLHYELIQIRGAGHGGESLVVVELGEKDIQERVPHSEDAVTSRLANVYVGSLLGEPAVSARHVPIGAEFYGSLVRQILTDDAAQMLGYLRRRDRARFGKLSAMGNDLIEADSRRAAE